MRFEVHGMPAILHPFRNCSNGTAVPVVRTILPSGFPARTQTPFAMQSLREEFGEKFSQVFKTITVDSGSEFSAFSQVENWGFAVYFAHLYTSWERPQNEHHNGLFRAFVPKGVSIESFSAEYILAAADELNGRPARSLATASRRNCLTSSRLCSRSRRLRQHRPGRKPAASVLTDALIH